jgi:hypothetical protein
MPVPARSKPSICSSDEGRQIDINGEQPESVLASIRVSIDPDSNVNDKSDSQDEKESPQKNSTDAGRQIDLNDEEFAKALLSISHSSYFISKEINSTNENSLVEEALLLHKSGVIMRGITRLRTLADRKTETDKNRTRNTLPPK